MKYVISSEGGQSQAGLEGHKAIDWNDYTYPPCSCIKMFHYVAEQTPQIHRKKAFMLRLNHILILVSILLNFLTNIIGAAQGVQNGGLRIGITIFTFFIMLPISFYIFIQPYTIMLGGDGSVIIFYALSAITFLYFFIWSIADFADANGFVQVGKNFSNGRGAVGFFGLVTAIMMMAISIIAVINTVLFYKRE